MTTKIEQMRVLNDRLRQNFSEGTAALTCGVAALGVHAQSIRLFVRRRALRYLDPASE